MPKHRFQKGNRAAVGNKGPHRDRTMTLELISQLNALDPQTNRSRLSRIIEKLIQLASGLYVEYETVKVKEKGKVVEKKIKVLKERDADLDAIMLIWDRLEGKPITRMASPYDEPPPKITAIETIIVEPDPNRFKTVEQKNSHGR